MDGRRSRSKSGCLGCLTECLKLLCVYEEGDVLLLTLDLQFTIQGCHADTQNAGSFFAGTFELRESRLDIFAFLFLDKFVERLTYLHGGTRFLCCILINMFYDLGRKI